MVAGAIVLAIFGSFLLVLTPVIGRPRGHPDGLGALLGLPPEVPAGLPAVVVHRPQQGVAGEARPSGATEETREIMALPRERGRPVADPAGRARPPRLPAARGVERGRPVGGELKVDAVNVALHIDQLLAAAAAAAHAAALTPRRWRRAPRRAPDGGGRRRRRRLPGDVRRTAATRRRQRLREAAARYRSSWEAAPPRSYGRLVAYLKSAVLAGDGDARPPPTCEAQLDGACDSPTSCYALAAGGPRRRRRRHRRRARRRACARATTPSTARPRRWRPWPPGTAPRYRGAVAAIVADFEGRDAHLTGVPVADTAMLMEALARAAAASRPIESPLMPAAR